MKAYLALSLLIAATASVEARANVDLNEYVLVNAAFGMDEMRGVPAPSPESAEQARALFEALTAPSVADVKFVGIAVNGVDNALGVHAQRHLIQIAVVVSKGSLQQLSSENGTLTFEGRVAEELFEALSWQGRAPIRSIGGLSCAPAGTSASRHPAVCLVHRVSFRGVSLGDLLDSYSAAFNERALVALVTASGL